MTNEEYVQAFQLLKDNLYQNYAIFHERVTLLVQLTEFDIQPERVNFKAKIIKPLNREHAEKNNLYLFMMGMDEIKFGSSYYFGPDDSNPLLRNSILGRPYCPFSLWLDPDLAKFVLESSDDITRQIAGYLRTGDDWKLLVPSNISDL